MEHTGPQSAEAKTHHEHIEHEHVGLSEKLQGAQLNLAAKDGADVEHHLSPWAAVKAYPMAIFWAVLVSMTVIMEGYDTILIGNFYAYPTFARKYGTYSKSGGYQLTPAWQAGVGNAAGVGSFFGVLLNGYLVGLFGQNRVLLGSLVVLSAFVFLTFFAPNIGVLTAGEVLCGIPWGYVYFRCTSQTRPVILLLMRSRNANWRSFLVFLPLLHLLMLQKYCLCPSEFISRVTPTWYVLGDSK